MHSEIAWFFVFVCGAFAIGVAARAAQCASAGHGARVPVIVGRLLGGVVILFGLAALLHVHAFAKADAHVVALLAQSRSPSLVSIFSVVTTMGDVVPTLLLSTAMAMMWYFRTGEVVRGLILPLSVIVEVILQISIARVLAIPMISTVQPDLVIGGAGPLPSGSLARLLSIFLIASFLWARIDGQVSSWLLRVGCVVTLVELVSRLYLGRHFLSDILAGLALGFLLAVAASWVMHVRSRVSKSPLSDSPMHEWGRPDVRGRENAAPR